MKKACCVVLGGTLAAVPTGAGVAMAFDPLARKSAGSAGGMKVRVATLENLPDDGIPRRFPILASHNDAWTKTPMAPVGAVYLVRTKETPKTVKAYNVVCPHAGCFVEYVSTIPNFTPEMPGYFCPCHNSSFKLDGAIANPDSPAPRGLDELQCSIENEQEIWVNFQNFQAGQAEKRPLGA